MQSARPSRSSEAPATASVAVAEDLRPGPPDYVGVGATHSGTSWWHALIGQHPRVFRQAGTPGGLHFFDGSLGGRPRRHGRGALPRVIRASASAGSAASGRRSTCSTPGRRACCARRLPRPACWCSCATPWSASTASARRTTTAPPAAPRRVPRPMRHSTAASTRTSWLRLWRAFPREQVLVLQVERCAGRHPRAAGAHLRRSSGSTSEVPADLDADRRLDASPGPAPTLSTWQLEELARRYAPENDRLAALLPDLDMTLWRRPR